jgi:hypothetical protein
MANYLEVYKISYDEFLKKEELNLKESLKKGLKQTRVYNTIFNNLHNSILEKEEIINSKLKKDNPKSTQVFDDRKKYYSNDEVRLVLTEEVRTAFLKENRNLVNSEISYSSFISVLANREGLKYINQHFYENYDLYKYMYKLNQLDLFKVDNLNTNSALAKQKKQLAFDLYGPPAAIVESSIEAIQAKVDQDILQKIERSGEMNSNVPNPSNKNQKIESIDESKELTNLKLDIDSFKKEEKYLLLHYYYQAILEQGNDNPKREYPQTEFVRIMCITNDLFDPKIFLHKEASKSTMYQKIDKGINYYTVGRNEKRKILQTLIEKLEKIKLPKATNYFRELRNK